MMYAQALEEMIDCCNDISALMERLIQKAFLKVQRAYFRAKGNLSFDNGERTSIVVPRYRDIEDANGNVVEKGKLRLSEQEFRFAFVEAFNELCNDTNLCYSVETPTKDKYLFSKGNTSDEWGLDASVPCITKYGESGNIDLVIYDNQEIAALIEFKAGNPDIVDYEKDFVKLTNIKESSENVQRYFLQIVESSDEGTIRNVKEKKLDEIAKKTKDEKNILSVKYRCYSLSHKGEQTERPIYKNDSFIFPN